MVFYDRFLQMCTLKSLQKLDNSTGKVKKCKIYLLVDYKLHVARIDYLSCLSLYPWHLA